MLYLPLQFAAHSSACEAEFLPPSTLKAAGVQVAVVSDVTPAIIIDWMSIHEDRLAASLDGVRDWEPEDLFTSQYVTGQSLLEAYAATLIADWHKDRFPRGHDLLNLTEWTAQNSANALFGPVTQDRKMDISALTHSERHALSLVAGRCFFRCDNGYIGLCPDGSEPGDIICVLLGCQTPVVLRSVGSDTFQLIGECYVHGMSDGNAFFPGQRLPRPWVVHQRRDQKGGPNKCWFVNTESDEVTQNDPRLPPLHNDWEILPVRTRTIDDPEVFYQFRNKTTGEVLNSDPRMTSEALRQRGVQVRSFSIV